MLIVGLTGGIGSGKSLVTEFFKELGASVIDTDLLARDVVQPGTPCLKQIADHFGSEILLADGSLNRQRLRDIIFNDAEEKSWLEIVFNCICT